LADDSEFARLVSLACHDLRTPLATVHGFATTLERGGGLEPPADRYVEMINAASAQLAELLDELSLVARIESGRYDPTLHEADTLELAEAAAARLGEHRVRVTGSGAKLETEPEAVERGLAALVQSALRHGGLDEVSVEVSGADIRVSRLHPPRRLSSWARICAISARRWRCGSSGSSAARSPSRARRSRSGSPNRPRT
jgi:signal transduction histidine kinase